MENSWDYMHFDIKESDDFFTICMELHTSFKD